MVFGHNVDLAADFDRKTARFGHEKRRFRAETDARMRHMWRISGFSSIPTVFGFSCEFPSGRDAPT
jgi:hypothetical protein